MTRVASAADLVVAKFNPLYRPYLLVSIGLTMLCTIIGAHELRNKIIERRERGG